MLTEAGYRNYYVGTVEAAPGLDDVLTAVKEGSYKKVVPVSYTHLDVYKRQESGNVAGR